MSDELVKAIRDELVMLWSDMTHARSYAHNGCWSGQCQNLADRIVTLSKLAGVTPWEEIDVAILRDGTYEKVLREAGLEWPPIDWDRVAHVEQMIAGGRGR